MIGLDTDCQEGDLYWTDVYNGQVRKSKVDGTEQTQVIGGRVIKHKFQIWYTYISNQHLDNLFKYFYIIE